MRADSPAPSFSFFLHGHLPWVLTHGRWPHGAEWLCEAVLESHLPLVRAFHRLERDGIRGGATVGISPVLAEQLAAREFRELFREFLRHRARTAAEDRERFAGEPPEWTAEWWHDFYVDSAAFFFDELGGDLLGAWSTLEESGVVEIATCGATHGYFPLLGRDESIALQVDLARRTHERHFGRPPRGIWLPEAAYRPAGPWRGPSGGDERWRRGLEEFLARAGLDYFLVDAGLLERGRRVELPSSRDPAAWRDRRRLRGEAETRASRDTTRSHWAGPGESGVAFFTRDPATATQVWSGESGYPGHADYLEFHKKSDTGGHRYWRVTGPNFDLGEKDWYSPERARRRAAEDAAHFHRLVRRRLDGGDARTILAAPYDLELFGHWWFEGVQWLEDSLRRLHEDPHVRLTTLERHRGEHPPDEAFQLPEGSWGNGGRHAMWSNDRVDWTWDLIHPSEEEVWELWAKARSSGRNDAIRVARAAARQLLLLSASDWQFLITTETATDYAVDRLRGHADDVARLVEMGRRVLEREVVAPDEFRFVETVESRDDLFPELDRSLDAALRMA